MTQQECNNNIELFRRNRYFYGKLMTVRDFEAEQDYMNGKRFLLNRLVTGAGIICGFNDVEVYTAAPYVNVKFNVGGVAVDCCGREIVVPSGGDVPVYRYEGESKVRLSAADTEFYPYLFLVHNPREYEYVNSPADPSSCQETCCANRILEDYEIIASDEVPGTPTINFPAIDEADDNDAVKDKFLQWFKSENTASCAPCSDIGVFFLALMGDGAGNPVTADAEETELYLSFVMDNRILSALIKTHLTDFDNPHRVTCEQIGALSGGGGELEGTTAVKNKPTPTISITGDNQQVSITSCQRQVWVDGVMISVPKPGGLRVHSYCAYALQGLLGDEVSLTQLYQQLNQQVFQNQLVLLQSGSSVLAQANQTPQQILSLLESSENPTPVEDGETEAITLPRLSTGTRINTAPTLSSGVNLNPSLTITHNFANLKKALAKLATGKRINRAEVDETGMSYVIPDAAVQGVSLRPGAYGVYACAPVGTPSLYVAGTSQFALPATFNRGMDGYVTSPFPIAFGHSLTDGQVVEAYYPTVSITSSHPLSVRPGLNNLSISKKIRVLGVASGVVSTASSITNPTTVLSLLESGEQTWESGEDSQATEMVINTNISSPSAHLSSGYASIAVHGVHPSVLVESINNEEIHVGDWLIVSDYSPPLTPTVGGYARKFTGNIPESGTSVGMALRGLPANTVGRIPVLLNIR